MAQTSLYCSPNVLKLQNQIIDQRILLNHVRSVIDQRRIKLLTLSGYHPKNVIIMPPILIKQILKETFM